MLYVFYVDIAKMLTFNMNLVNESVLRLKHAIEEDVGVPVSKQVLLISGGICLSDSAKVCIYSAGTDTNPIYLYNRLILERGELPNLLPDYRYSPQIDSELCQSYEGVMVVITPPSLHILNKMSMLAQKYTEQAFETKVYCDQLHNDLLLQQQGLAAAIANLDDVLGNFKSQYEAFDLCYTRYLENREEDLKLINRCLEEDLKLLSQIPLLPALLDSNEEERSRVEMCWERTNLSDLTLLNWIAAKDPEQSLEAVIEGCRATLIKYDENAMISLKEDVDKLFHPDRFEKLHNYSSNSEISGKLIVFQRFTYSVRDKYEEQAKKASGIKRNYERAYQLKDNSVLFDLLDTHRNTIESMRSNHQSLRSSRQLCTQAKKELCDVIHDRLKDIMNVQELAAEIQAVLKLQGDYLKRIRAHVEIVHQLHTTPRNYMAAVSEVVRRRSYSQAFLMWAGDIACRISEVCSEEVERRKKFLSEFQGHFLTCLFPGLEDMPPAFATQSPPLFDDKLPALWVGDLKLLCDNLPFLKENAELPNVEAIRDFFLSKSLTFSRSEYLDDNEEKIDRNSINDEQTVVTTRQGINNQSSSSMKCEPPTQYMITSSYSNCGTQNSINMNDSSKRIEEVCHENNVQSMKRSMALIGSMAQTAMITMRDDLSVLNSCVFAHQSEIKNMVENLKDKMEHQRNEIETLSKMSVSKDETIKSLLAKLSQMELDKLENENAVKEARENIIREHDRAIREVTENLNQCHKQEIEALRQRFKLVACTNMERCPSETSLEKVENVIDSTKHEQMMAQLKMNMELQMGEVLEVERATHQQRLDELTAKHDAEKLSLAKSVRESVMEAHAKKVEDLKIKENSLMVELQRHKDTIHTLAAPEGSSTSLMRRIEQLENEKRNLESELVKERLQKYHKPTAQSTVTSMMSSEGDGSSSSLNSNLELPINRSRLKEKPATKKKRRPFVLLTINEICLQTCNVGDLVLVVWNEAQKNYTIAQESKFLHFLHPASIDSLGLKPIADGGPRIVNCPAEVTEKECCKSKKKNNRYNVPINERFFRVKAKPLRSSVIHTTCD